MASRLGKKSAAKKRTIRRASRAAGSPASVSAPAMQNPFAPLTPTAYSDSESKSQDNASTGAKKAAPKKKSAPRKTVTSQKSESSAPAKKAAKKAVKETPAKKTATSARPKTATRSTHIPPSQSHDTLVQMSQRGSELRHARALFLDRLRKGEVPAERFTDLLDEARLESNEETFGKIRVLNFVRALPSFGKITAQNFLVRANIPDRKYLSKLTDAQVDRLVKGVFDVLSEREIVRGYGKGPLTSAQAEQIILEGTSRSKNRNEMLSQCRVRTVVHAIKGVRTERAAAIVDSSGVDVNARLHEITRAQGRRVIGALPKSR